MSWLRSEGQRGWTQREVWMSRPSSLRHPRSQAPNPPVILGMPSSRGTGNRTMTPWSVPTQSRPWQMRRLVTHRCFWPAERSTMRSVHPDEGTIEHEHPVRPQVSLYKRDSCGGHSAIGHDACSMWALCVGAQLPGTEGQLASMQRPHTAKQTASQ